MDQERARVNDFEGSCLGLVGRETQTRVEVSSSRLVKESRGRAVRVPTVSL